MHLPGYGSLMPEFKKLSGYLVDTLDIRSQRIPSSRKLKEYSSLILVGDFADNSDTSSGTKLNLELIELWTSLSIQKSWVLLNDLHFGVEKLLLGKNNSISEKLNSSESIVNVLCSSIDKLFWRHEQNDYKDFTQDYLYEDRLKHRLLNDIKTEFTQKFRHRIDLPVLMRPKEFVDFKSIKSTNKRKYDYFIPGREYESRKDFKKMLSSTSFTSGPYFFVDSAIRRYSSRLQKINLKYFKDKEFQMRYLNQRYFIANSKFTYTDGNHVDYLVRKFLEIPASGGLLVAPNSSITSMYGFKPWINFIPLEDWEKIFDSDPNMLSEITKNGYLHVKNHFNMRTSLPKVVDISRQINYHPEIVERIF